MAWLRIFCLPLLVAVALVLTDAPGQQPSAQSPRSDSPPKPDSAPSLKEDPKSAALLKKAIENLDPKKHPWITTTLWQEVDLPGLMFQAEGTYQSGSENRLRLDLQVHLANTKGKLTVVSDGATLWESLQTDNGRTIEIIKMDLQKVLKTLSNYINDQILAEFLQRQSFVGVTPLLQNIQRHMTVTRQEAGRWKGQPVVKLTAAWSDNVRKMIQQPSGSLQDYRPRQCCLYLDPEMLYWPLRLEWWGPVPGRKDDALLLQMEFRDAQLDHPLSKEQADLVFSFKPGTAQVMDVTKQELEFAAARHSQLTGQNQRR